MPHRHGFVHRWRIWRREASTGLITTLILHGAFLVYLASVPWPVPREAPRLDYARGTPTFTPSVQFVTAAELTPMRQTTRRRAVPQVAPPPRQIPLTGPPLTDATRPSPWSPQPTTLNPLPMPRVDETTSRESSDSASEDLTDSVPLPPTDTAAEPGIETGVRFMNQVSPVYPRVSRERGEQGLVVLLVRIDADGKVAEVQVVVDPGHRRLVDAAIAAARASRFRPAMRDGQPVAAWVRLPYRFVLR